jgi:glutathionylspermidine synthase
MERLAVQPRENWRRLVESKGMAYHTIDGNPYWDESACYRFTSREIDALDDATVELQRLSLAAVEQVVRRDMFDRLRIPRDFVPLVTRSWEAAEPSLYGRFDLVYDGFGPPKLLEYNADTPTALLEASVIQWFWLQDVFPDADQFNSIHEKLIDFWQGRPDLRSTPAYFACVDGNAEDLGNVEYLMDTAMQGGVDARFIFVEEIGWERSRSCFVDLEDSPIATLFKLYPWEWMVREEFGPNLLISTPRMIEPAWKMILSNKGILPLLWEMFPGHPFLLPASFDREGVTGDFVKKPLLSREGGNVTIFKGSDTIENPGTYGEEGWMYQAYAPLPRFDGNHAVIGSWVIGGKAAGIGIREDTGPITTNASRFVPHFFEEG